MQPDELKQEFGAHLTFYGGIDVQELMPHGTVQEVRHEVRRLIDSLGQGGRYILAPSHFLMDDVPVENVLALYDEARSHPIGEPT
jgi:uroporphyrinogen decarboxylase